MSYTMELYVSEYGMGKSSVAWNYIQTQHSTCGVFGALDWQDSQWAKHRECYVFITNTGVHIEPEEGSVYNLKSK